MIIFHMNSGKRAFANKEIDLELFESENGYFDPLSINNNKPMA